MTIDIETMLTVNVDEIDVPQWQRQLVYVDYRDGLSQKDVEQAIHEGWSDSVDEWANGAQWESAHDLAVELLPDGYTQADMEAMIERLYELDTSDPYRDLLSNTGHMLFRFSPSEDGMAMLCDELDDQAAAREALGLDEQFEHAVEAILPEIAGYKWEGGGWFGATFVFSCNPADLWLKQRVRIHDPFLWLTNPYSGNGYGVVAEGCTVELNVEDIHVDKFAWGYGADDVFGGLILPDSTIEEVEE